MKIIDEQTDIGNLLNFPPVEGSNKKICYRFIIHSQFNFFSYCLAFVNQVFTFEYTVK